MLNRPRFWRLAAGGRTAAVKNGLNCNACHDVFKSAFLVLGENEITIKEQRSDYYIYCRPDIPDDHLLRITRNEIIKTVKNQPHFPKYRNAIPKFVNIRCEIAGFCALGELEKANSIPGQDFDGIRYIKKSGLLHRSREEWRSLLGKL